MTVLEKASCHNCWQEFLDYKTAKQQLQPREAEEIRDFVERRAYLKLCEAWERGEFPGQYPVKKEINKQGTGRKRVVYTFPGDEGIFLKFAAFCLYSYDGHFNDNCYAFRRKFGVREAIRRIRQIPDLGGKYCLKADISDYFNSISVGKLLEKLVFVREEDPKLYALFERILGREEVWEDGRLAAERHGAMAGIPLSPFFANVYLGEADAFFQERDIPYFRYSDDILIFADSERELSERQEELCGILERLELALNPRKMHICGPGEVWEFLGFCYREGEIDLSETTVGKVKAKIRRKAEALRRWQRKKGLSGDKAAIGLIHAMNRKFYGAPVPEAGSPGAERKDMEEGAGLVVVGGMGDGTTLGAGNDFTWSRWFFPNLTTDTGLREVDAYFAEYIRYAVTGRHYKGNYRISYAQLKAWGYRSLVHEYYRYREGRYGF